MPRTEPGRLEPCLVDSRPSTLCTHRLLAQRNADEDTHLVKYPHFPMDEWMKGRSIGHWAPTEKKACARQTVDNQVLLLANAHAD